MATDIVHLSLSNWMGMKEGIDRKYVGGRRMERRGDKSKFKLSNSSSTIKY